MKLANYTTNRNNNFNLIRFVAAIMVLFSHSYALALGNGAHDPIVSIIGMSLGSMAVDVFFITSGFLITASLLQRNSLVAFVWNRILRIYPALFVAVLFCIIVVGWAFTSLNTEDYFYNKDTILFWIKNSTLILGGHGDLPNVFENNPYKYAVNGSLWTLPYEIRMYGLLFFLGLIYFSFSWATKKHLEISIVIIGVLSFILHLSNHYFEFIHFTFLKLGLWLLSMFFMGASFYVLRKHITVSIHATMILISILVISSFNKDIFYLLYTFTICYIVLAIAYIPSGFCRGFNRWGDYSYGIYIYAFPVQQSLAATFRGISVSEMILSSFLITFMLAFASWHLIEKRALKYKFKYTSIEKYLLALNNTWLSRVCSEKRSKV